MGCSALMLTDHKHRLASVLSTSALEGLLVHSIKARYEMHADGISHRQKRLPKALDRGGDTRETERP